MIATAKPTAPKKLRRHSRHKLRLRLTRHSILDPRLESEPSLDCCCCGQTLALFLHNHPIALIPGTSLDYFALSNRLSQLRHRWPRQTEAVA
jgi:hypothetical protein